MIIKLRKNIFSIFMACFFVLETSIFAFAAPEIIVPQKADQGTAFKLSIPHLGNEYHKITLLWQDKYIPLYLEEHGRHKEVEILLAMPIDAKTPQPLAIFFGNETVNKEIMPIKKNFRKSTLSVAPNYVKPPQEVQDQIEKDRASNRKVLATHTMANTIQDELIRPVPGIVTSEYGVQRVYNNSLQSIHRGVDFRGAMGSPIYAVADGIVATAELQYYIGNVVYLDHGQGVYSIYGHMSDISVKKGDFVQAGQEVGKVGSTGRSTGPHLHLSLTLQGISIDSMPLFPKTK